MKPLVVRGVGFEPGERVTLRAVTREGTKIRRITATAAGTLVARFAISGDVCAVGLLRVVASGARGSRAVLRVPIGACQPLGVDY